MFLVSACRGEMLEDQKNKKQKIITIEIDRLRYLVEKSSNSNKMKLNKINNTFVTKDESKILMTRDRPKSIKYVNIKIHPK